MNLQGKISMNKSFFFFFNFKCLKDRSSRYLFKKKKSQFFKDKSPMNKSS